MITVEELTKQYGGHRPVDRVSFQARPGSVTGFLGPNGAGKSTTLRMLTGLTTPSAGHSTILGVPYASSPTRAGTSAYCWTPRRSTTDGPDARCSGSGPP